MNAILLGRHRDFLLAGCEQKKGSSALYVLLSCLVVDLAPTSSVGGQMSAEEVGDFDVAAFQMALSRLPAVPGGAPGDSPGESNSPMGAALSAIGKVLRKQSVHQLRGTQALQGLIEAHQVELEATAARASREHERALASETQGRALTRALILALDLVSRMGAALNEASADSPALEPWATHVGMATSSLEEEADRAGLVPLARVGEAYDPERHDSVDGMLNSMGPGGAVIVGVVMQGYSQAGAVLRRPKVRVRERKQGDR